MFSCVATAVAAAAASFASDTIAAAKFDFVALTNAATAAVFAAATACKKRKRHRAGLIDWSKVCLDILVNSTNLNSFYMYIFDFNEDL